MYKKTAPIYEQPFSMSLLQYDGCWRYHNWNGIFMNPKGEATGLMAMPAPNNKVAAAEK